MSRLSEVQARTWVVLVLALLACVVVVVTDGTGPGAAVLGVAALALLAAGGFLLTRDLRD